MVKIKSVEMDNSKTFNCGFNHNKLSFYYVKKDNQKKKIKI